MHATPLDAVVDRARLDAVARCAESLAGLGHEVEEIDGNPWNAEDVLPLFVDVFAVGSAAFAGFGEMVSGRRAGEDTLDPLTWKIVQRGRELPALALAGAQTILNAWSRGVIVALSGYDAVLSPVLSGAPLPIGAFAHEDPSIEATLGRAFSWAPFPVVANITGLPALAIPRGLDGDGLPVAVQLLGRQAGEDALIALGAQLGP